MRWGWPCWNLSAGRTPLVRWASYRTPALNALITHNTTWARVLPDAPPPTPPKPAHPGLCPVSQLRLMKSTREPPGLAFILLASSAMAGDL